MSKVLGCKSSIRGLATSWDNILFCDQLVKVIFLSWNCWFSNWHCDGNDWQFYNVYDRISSSGPLVKATFDSLNCRFSKWHCDGDDWHFCNVNDRISTPGLLISLCVCKWMSADICVLVSVLLLFLPPHTFLSFSASFPLLSSHSPPLSPSIRTSTPLSLSLILPPLLSLPLLLSFPLPPSPFQPPTSSTTPATVDPLSLTTPCLSLHIAYQAPISRPSALLAASPFQLEFESEVKGRGEGWRGLRSAPRCGRRVPGGSFCAGPVRRRTPSVYALLLGGGALGSRRFFC